MGRRANATTLPKLSPRARTAPCSLSREGPGKRATELVPFPVTRPLYGASARSGAELSRARAPAFAVRHARCIETGILTAPISAVRPARGAPRTLSPLRGASGRIGATRRRRSDFPLLADKLGATERTHVGPDLKARRVSVPDPLRLRRMLASATNEGARLKEAWGRHLARYPWTHFCTLTFKKESVQDYARRQFLSFVRRVDREIGDASMIEVGALVRDGKRFARRERGSACYWFYGTEFGNLGRMHLHALIGRTESLPREVLEKLWLCGHSRFREYDPLIGSGELRGAAHYVTKYITKDLADYDVSPGFPGARAMYVGRQRELSGLSPRFAVAPGERSPLPPSRRRYSQ
jgi:hypothetical protein